jgi:hypothetical protein
MARRCQLAVWKDIVWTLPGAGPTRITVRGRSLACEVCCNGLSINIHQLACCSVCDVQNTNMCCSGLQAPNTRCDTAFVSGAAAAADEQHKS